MKNLDSNFKVDWNRKELLNCCSIINRLIIFAQCIWAFAWYLSLLMDDKPNTRSEGFLSIDIPWSAANQIASFPIVTWVMLKIVRLRMSSCIANFESFVIIWATSCCQSRSIDGSYLHCAGHRREKHICVLWRHTTGCHGLQAYKE